MILSDQSNPEPRAYIESRLGVTLPADAIFIASDEPSYGVIAFERYSGDEVEAHVSGEPGFLSRRLLKAAGHYAFEQLGVDRVTCFVLYSNLRMLSVADRVGFRYEGTKRKAHNSQAMLMLGLLQEDFICGRQKEKRGQGTCGGA